ncbi:amino acid permease-domain-containing protein [Mycena galericulata]|nr:amino acid permease-domain-containing protein [Mycena galericulata]
MHDTYPPSSLAAPSTNPPTFHESQFAIVLRKQRTRPLDGGGLKHSLAISSRFLNLSSDFEFAGWGSIVRLKLTADDHAVGEECLQRVGRVRLLGQLTGTALPGNAVLGGVFFALPAVVAVCGVYSPIALFMATLTPFIWRPIMEELASALPLRGAPYSYILNISRKSLALLGATLLLLNFASTSVVSASTASSYLAGEVVLPFPAFVGAALVLAIFALVSLTGLKESARIAFVVLAFHVATMTALAVASSVHLAQTGNAQLKRNWIDGQAPSRSAIARNVFDGFCLGMLGLTGIECTPAYIERMKPGRFPLVLRNMHLPAIVLNTLMITLVLATMPLETVLGGANVLSVLAEVLRNWIVVEAVVVLCSGVSTGILSACELFKQLAHDRILPQLFLKALPFSGAPYLSISAFSLFNAMLYSTSALFADIKSRYSLVWLTVMDLFPVALLLLRLPRQRAASLSILALALAVAPLVFTGNRGHRGRDSFRAGVECKK